MLISTSSQVRYMSGYLSGLSSPSVIAATITRTSSPTRNSAGQTRLPTFSITSRSISASGTDGSAERTMLASRWHSPPKPESVLICVTGTCSERDARRVVLALHVALEHADADAVAERALERPLEQARLAGARGAHEVDDGHAVAIEVVAVGARDRVVGVERVLDDANLHPVHAGSSTSIDSTSNSFPASTATSRRRTPGSGTTAPRHATQAGRLRCEPATGWREVPARRSAQASVAGDGLVLERRALAERAARDVLEVERERVGHDLAQLAEPQPDEQ